MSSLHPSPDSDTSSPSHFSEALKELLRSEPRRSDAAWCVELGFKQPYLSKLLNNKIPVGHKTVARLARAFPPKAAKRLVVAFLLDEAVAIGEAGAEIKNGPPEVAVGPAGDLEAAADKALKQMRTPPPPDPIAQLPPRVRSKLSAVALRAKEDPTLLGKLEALLKLLEK